MTTIEKLEHYLGRDTIISIHHFCTREGSFEYRILCFKEGKTGWEPSAEDNAEIGVEVCATCGNPRRLNDLRV